MHEMILVEIRAMCNMAQVGRKGIYLPSVDEIRCWREHEKEKGKKR